MRMLIAAALACSVAGCAANPEATEALLRQQGYTPVNTWPEPTQCPHHYYKTGFAALDRDGKPVSGVACISGNMFNDWVGRGQLTFDIPPAN